MSRALVSYAVILLLGLTLLAQAQLPSGVQTPQPAFRVSQAPEQRQPMVLQTRDNGKTWIGPWQSRRPNELYEFLSKPHTFKAIDDEKMTLKQFFEHLADRFEILFDINDQAFRADKVKDVRSIRLFEKPFPKLVNVSLASVLRRACARIPARSGATYLIRRNWIEITTWDAIRKEHYSERRGGRPLVDAPLVMADFKRTPLFQAVEELTEQATVNLIVNRTLPQSRTPITARFVHVPLDVAIDLLVDMANLEAVRLENVIYVTSKEGVERLRKAREARLLLAKGDVSVVIGKLGSADTETVVLREARITNIGGRRFLVGELVVKGEQKKPRERNTWIPVDAIRRMIELKKPEFKGLLCK